MSNEELAMLIQSGDLEQLPQLWAQVERLVAWKAGRTILHLDGAGSVEFDDLYNTGYLAMIEAVWTYRPEKGMFSTWLMLYLKTAFAAAAGYRTATQRSAPDRHALSLSTPLTDDDGGELMDLIPDPVGQQQLEDIEEQIYRRQLSTAMEKVLESLPEKEYMVIRLRFYECRTLEEIARQMCGTRERIRMLETNALSRIRRASAVSSLLPFLDENFYAGTTLGAFRSRGMSVQEWYLVKQERARKIQEQQIREQLRQDLEVLACGDDSSKVFKLLDRWV